MRSLLKHGVSECYSNVSELIYQIVLDSKTRLFATTGFFQSLYLVKKTQKLRNF